MKNDCYTEFFSYIPVYQMLATNIKINTFTYVNYFLLMIYVMMEQMLIDFKLVECLMYVHTYILKMSDTAFLCVICKTFMNKISYCISCYTYVYATMLYISCEVCNAPLFALFQCTL